MKLHYETISTEMKEVMIQLMAVEEFNSFRLVGGTSLALQLGHRVSVDLDFFAGGGIDTRTIAGTIRNNFGESALITRVLQNGINAVINGIKVDIYDWKVPFAKPPLIVDGLRLASVEDLFANKCEALIDRKSEKDFCDIAEIFKHIKLPLLIPTLKQRYAFISLGAIFTILIKENAIIKDETIKLLKGNTFEKYFILVKKELKEYEESIQKRKKIESEKRDERIRLLIEQKRKNK